MDWTKQLDYIPEPDERFQESERDLYYKLAEGLKEKGKLTLNSVSLVENLCFNVALHNKRVPDVEGIKDTEEYEKVYDRNYTELEKNASLLNLSLKEIGIN